MVPELSFHKRIWKWRYTSSLHHVSHNFVDNILFVISILHVFQYIVGKDDTLFFLPKIFILLPILGSIIRYYIIKVKRGSIIHVIICLGSKIHFSHPIYSHLQLCSPAGRKEWSSAYRKKLKTLNHVEIVEKNPSTEPSPWLLFIYFRLEMTAKEFNQF